METMISYLGLLINATLIATPPLLFAALGPCFSERSGVVNIGIEGMMTIGAFTGAAVAYFTGNGWLAFLCGGLVGAAFGVVHAIACVSLHADQTIAGTAINFIGPGLAIFLSKAMFDNSSDTPPVDVSAKLPKLFEGVFEAGSFGANVLNVYSVAYLVFVLAFVCWFVFYKTKFGRHLRAVGEHPEACESLGINVYKVRYICVILSGFLAGLGGACETLGINSRFAYGGLTSHGWDGIMLAVIANNDPKKIPFAALFLAYIRTGADVLNRTSSMPTEVVKIIQAVVIALICAKGILSKHEYKAIVNNAKKSEV